MWLVCIATVGGGAAFIGSLTWIPTYFVRIVNLSEVYAGSISSLLALAGIFGTPIGGFIADRILRKRSPIVFSGIFASGLSCIFFSIVMPSDLYSAIAWFIPIPFFSAVWWIGPSLLSEWFPLQVLGTATGILNFMTISGCVLGPIIFGLILDLTGSFSHGWFALGSIASLSALLMIPIMLQDSKNV
jgi:ACS family D-galactonate transporter-like MFS transporter